MHLGCRQVSRCSQPEPICLALFEPRDTASVWQFSLRKSLTKRYFWDLTWSASMVCIEGVTSHDMESKNTKTKVILRTHNTQSDDEHVRIVVVDLTGRWPEARGHFRARVRAARRAGGAPPAASRHGVHPTAPPSRYLWNGGHTRVGCAASRRLATRLSRPAYACLLPLGPWALGPTLPQSPGGRAAWRAHVSTGSARRARASGTPPTPPTAAARPPPRRRRPHRASRDAPPRRRARTPRCTPAPTHMSYAWAKAARGAEEAGVKGVCVLRGRGYLRGWSLTPWQRWTG